MQVNWRAISVLSAAAIYLIACGSESASTPEPPSAEPPELEFPEGNDNLIGFGSVAGADGALYSALAVGNGYLYGCTGSSGISISKVNAPDNLEIVTPSAMFPNGAGCRDVALATDGSLVVTGQSNTGGSFVGRMSHGAQADVVVLEAEVELEGAVETIVATGSHIFATVGGDGIQIVGWNGGELTLVSSLSAGFDQALGADLWCHSKSPNDSSDPGTCDRLVVANGLSGVAVVDVSDPTNPLIESTFQTYGTARRVVVEGDWAYIASVSGGVGIYDLSSDKPYPPLGSWSTHASAVDLAVSEDGRVFVANLEDLCVLDASDPYSLSLLGSELVPTADGSNPRVVSVRDHLGVAYVAEWSALWAYGFAEGRTAPDIHLAKLSLNFGLVSLKKGKGVVIQNLGSEALEIWDVQADHPDFEVDIGGEKLTLAPGDLGLLEIVFSPSDDQPVEAFATLHTNDPDESEVRIPLVANQLDGAQVGAKFDPNGELVYNEYSTGNEVTVKGEHSGKVVLLAYFATW